MANLYATLSAQVADAFGIDRTVPRNVAEMCVAYKRHAYATGPGANARTPGFAYLTPLGLGPEDRYVIIRLPKGMPAMSVPGEVVEVPHASDSDCVAVAVAIPRNEDLPPIVGHSDPYHEVFDRWEAWVARWIVERCPDFEEVIRAYRAPAKPYATSWNALMPELQRWLAGDYGRQAEFIAALGAEVVRAQRPNANVAQPLFSATPEDVCRAVIACASPRAS